MDLDALRVRPLAEFKWALPVSPSDHSCRVPVQSNLAMAKSVLCQVDEDLLVPVLSATLTGLPH